MNKFLILFINLIFLIILYYVIELYYNRFHKFWRIQPISKYNLLKFKEGIISLSPPPDVVVNSNYFIQNDEYLEDEDIIKLKVFLNENYSDNSNWNYQFDEQYLNYFLNNPLEKKRQIKIILKNTQNQIVGFISAISYRIILRKKTLFTLYADNLCVLKSLRKKNLASILISNLTNVAYQKGYNIIIFRKDSIPLPFKFITVFKNNIYYLPNGNYNFTNIFKGKNNDFNIIYQYFSFNIKKKNNSYIDYSILDFKKYFFNDYIDIWYQKDEKMSISNLIICYMCPFLINNQKVIDIPHIFIDNKRSLIILFNNIIRYYQNKGYTYCNLNNFDNSIQFLEYNLDIYFSYSTYIQMYNYHINFPIIKSNFYFL